MPWSIPNRKSRRPWAMNTGVVTEPSFERLERSAAHGLTAAVFPAKAAAVNDASDGSRRASGIELDRPATRPDLTSPCGKRAEARSVHVSTVTTAAHGTPATRELNTAPPP